MKLQMLAATAALMMFAGAAAAQDQGGHGGMAAMREACGADMQKFCADKMGPDRRACMEANKDKLSDGCKAAMAAMQQRMQQGGGTPPAKPN